MNRQEELQQLFDAHSAAEAAQDLEWALSTCTEDIVYEHPLYGDDHPDRETHGREALREYYLRSWKEAPFHDVVITRSWLSGEDTLVIEVEAKIGRPGAAKGTVRGVAVGIFRGNLLAREISYAPLPATTRAKVRR